MPGHEGLELLIQAADGGVHILPGANTCRQQETKAERQRPPFCLLGSRGLAPGKVQSWDSGKPQHL